MKIICYHSFTVNSDSVENNKHNVVIFCLSFTSCLINDTLILFKCRNTLIKKHKFICTRRFQMSPLHWYCRTRSREDTFRWAEVAAAASHMIERFARCGKSDLCTHNQFKMLKNFPTSWLVNLRSLAELSKSISIKRSELLLFPGSDPPLHYIKLLKIIFIDMPAIDHN